MWRSVDGHPSAVTRHLRAVPRSATNFNSPSLLLLFIFIPTPEGLSID